MGVVIVQHYPIPDDKNGTQIMEMLQQRVENLGGVKAGSISVECESYFSAPNLPQRCVNVIHSTEYPASCFSLLDNGNCLVSDVLFESLMGKLTGMYSPKKGARIEAKGPRFEVVDFLVKIVSVSVGSSFKGILVEVDYQPCAIPSSCWDLMKEFVQGFLGNCLQTIPNQLQNRFNDVCTPTDVIQQYMEYFNNYRKAVLPGQR